MPAHKAAPTEADVYGLVVGTVVTRLREERRWSQAELAQKLSTTQSTVSRIERGKAEPGPFLYRRIADAFGYTAGEMIALVDAAYDRTRDAARRSMKGEAKIAWWQNAVAVVGLVGLVGLVGFAVAGVLGERKRKKEAPRR